MIFICSLIFLFLIKQRHCCNLMLSFFVQGSNLVPVQITVPAQQAGGTAKTITIHVPSTALSNGVAGAQLQTILSAPAAAQTFALEVRLEKKCLLASHYASPSSGEAYRDRRLTTNFEL